MTGTSTKGPMSAANDCPEFTPKTAIATAMASSKLLLAAVKESVVDFSLFAPAFLLMKKLQYVHRNAEDETFFQAEDDENRKKKRNERDGADRPQEALGVPRLAFGAQKNKPAQHPGKKWDAQINKDAAGDLSHRDRDRECLKPHKARQVGQEEVRVNAVKENLEDAVEGDQPGRVFGVSTGEPVLDHDHRDAAGKTDQDKPGQIVWLVLQKRRRQTEHQKRPDDPVLHEA